MTRELIPTNDTQRHEADGRMRAAYVRKVNSVVQAGREELAHELSETFLEESSGSSGTGGRVDPLRGRAATRRLTGRGTPGRSGSGRPPRQAAATLGRMSRLTRQSLDRFDRYTLEVFNPGAPYRTRTDRPAED